MSVRTRGVWRPLQILAGVMTLALASGCATAPGADPRDPWEPYNRSMTKFNDAVDDAVLKPVATAYRDVLPQPVRTGVGNFFGNLGDAWSFVNNVLQGKPEGSLHSFWRVMINSTIGLGGVLDPATEMRLERHREDFGQTLGRWGMPPGPYFVIPLLGPSTVRDAAAFPVDVYGNPLGYMHDVAWRNSLALLGIVNVRAQVLGATDLLDAAALDPYTFKRDAFLQRRQNEVYDGNPPQDEERYDLEEDEVAPANAAPAEAASTAKPKRRVRRARPTSQAPTESLELTSAQAVSSPQAERAPAEAPPLEAVALQKATDSDASTH